MNLDTFLSPHFRLRELVASHHRTIDNTPSEAVVNCLVELCRRVLEPIRQAFGPLVVSSGYRCEALNEAVGGSHDSAHLYGCAADFMPADISVSVEQVVLWVHGGGLPYDQVIDERTPTAAWVHVGMARPEQQPRHEALVYRNGIYIPFGEQLAQRQTTQENIT